MYVETVLLLFIWVKFEYAMQKKNETNSWILLLIELWKELHKKNVHILLLYKRNKAYN